MHSATLVKHNSHQLNESPKATGPLLIKLGGAAIDQAADHAALFQALCDLHRAMRVGSEGDGIVLMHGGGVTVDRRLERLGLVSERRDGIRITPPEHIDEVVAALAGLVNKRLVGTIQRHGVAAVGLCLGDGFTANSVKAGGYSFDPGCVGEVCGGDERLINLLLGAGYMPVLCSIGLDDQGQPLNINADDAAADMASVLGCRGVILLTDVSGVLDAQGNLIDELTCDEIEHRIASGEIKGGMIPKVRGAMRAARSAGSPVTITSWNDPAALMKLSRGEAIGTRIMPDVVNTREFIIDSNCVATPWSDVL